MILHVECDVDGADAWIGTRGEMDVFMEAHEHPEES